jgi:DNA-binding transcriptional MerR regulator
MSANPAIVVAFVTVAVMMLWGALSKMCQKEIETRIGRIPDALIRLAGSRLPREARDDVADEWRAELDFILRDTDGLPITRLLRGMHFAVGLLWVPPGTARELSGSDETVVSGYLETTAVIAAGITYRQLDYWVNTGLVEPSVRSALGSGAERLYGFRDILVLKAIKRMLDTGISLEQIRAALEHLRHRGTEDLAQVTLISDGVSVYECTSPYEVVDLLVANRGLFGIALGLVRQELEGYLGEPDHRGDV